MKKTCFDGTNGPLVEFSYICEHDPLTVLAQP